MNQIIYFICGVLFMLIAQPVMSAISDLLCSICITLQTKLEVSQAQDTLKMKQLAAEAAKLMSEDEVSTTCIGFQMPADKCCEEEEEEDDDY